MIRMQDYTPEVYYMKSRDFQFIGRLYDLVLNYSKTNADLLYSLPFSDNSDDQLIDLLALTVGFKAKHQYPGNQLRAVCSVFLEMMRNKGTVRALQIACAAIFKSEGIVDQVEYSIDENHSKITLYVPAQISNLLLLNDLLDYILPVGMQCNIIKELKLKSKNETKFKTLDEVELMNRGQESAGEAWKKVIYSGNYSSYINKVEELSKTDINNAYAKDTSGIIMNSTLWKKEDD